MLRREAPVSVCMGRRYLLQKDLMMPQLLVAGFVVLLGFSGAWCMMHIGFASALCAASTIEDE